MYKNEEKKLYEAMDIVSQYVKENGFVLNRNTFGKWRDVMEDIEQHVLETRAKERQIDELVKAEKRLAQELENL